MRLIIIVFKLILSLFELLLFVRAILSWFPINRSGALNQFLEYTTEPVLTPIRSLLYRSSTLRNFPIDFSYIAAFLLIQILNSLL